jgi:glycosyltransferase involved in cell wall biosynthesis
MKRILRVAGVPEPPAERGLLDNVSVLVLTFNEAPNIARTLDALRTFPEVVVLDSGSTDDTVAIARRYANVRICSRSFDSHAAQWNHGLTACGLNRPWVLALDADYAVTPALLEEMTRLTPPDRVAGYRTRFSYFVWGQELTGSLYPAVITLYRRSAASYVQDGHTQRVVLQGEVVDLGGKILHDDRKPLSRWLASQERYAQLECDLLLARRWADLSWRDRLRRMAVVTPWLVPLYCLTVRRGLLDGVPGVYYAMQRAMAEGMLALKLLEARLKKLRD